MSYRKMFYRVAAAGAGVDMTMDEADRNAAVGQAMINGGGLEAMDDLANALVLAVVKDWGYGAVDLPTLLDVPTADLEEIQRRCAGEEYIKVLQPDFDPSPDPDSPTKPSEP